MKNYIHNLFITMALSATTSSIYTYKESFSNHTDKNIAIAMKYKGSKNLEFIVITPHGKQQFEPGASAIAGVKNAIDSNKANAIPSTWHYLIDPPSINDDNKNSLSWASLRIIWFKTETHKILLAITQAINKSDKSAETITELIKTGSNKANPEIVQQFESADHKLETFIATEGKEIGHSMAQDFHIDIIEDENGNIHFIAPL